MKATDLLEAQHKDVEKLFNKLEKADTKGDKAAAFEELAKNLCAHDAIERELFYPACEKQMGLTDELGEAFAEHGLVELSLYLCNEALGKKDFDYKCTVLREIVEHHVEEEEDEFFPKVKRAFDKAALEDLGAKMEVRFEEAKGEDFREPLYGNVRQVLEGALKTKPEKTTNGGAPAKTATTDKSRSHSRSAH